MTYAAIAILALIAARYRRKYIREAERCAKLRTNLDLLMQERWVRTIQGARKVNRDRRSAEKMRRLRRDHLLDAQAMRIATVAVESLNRSGPVLTELGQNWSEQ